MGSFNWFNRQYDDKSNAEQSKAAESPEATPPAPPEETAAAPAQPAVNQDYLTWAKTAYAAIRKRQEEEALAAPTVAEPTVEEETPEEAAEISSTAASTDSETLETTAAEAEASEMPVLEAPEEAPKPAVAPSEAAAPLPFWAQAEAERLERLQRLKIEAAEAAKAAEAAEAAETATTVPAAPPAAPAIPEVVLDEAFLWSAEVLAAQGRRPDEVSIEEITWLKRLRQGLGKTRRNLVNQLRAIVGQGPLNQDAVMEIEALLLQSDVGIEATDRIIEALQTRLRQEALPPQEAISYLKQLLRDMLDEPLGESHTLSFVPERNQLNIWLITGVNGAGKTTTIGKLAHIARKSGYRCLIAAADTFRAAAVQQVKVWGERSQVEVIANPGKNTDPAAVVFDAITAAQSRNTELLLIDTAGRLQNKKNLMDELGKIRRIIDKKAPDAHVESLLVLDATLGQNGLRQAEVFSEVAKLSGVVLTKLDGTAKGGIALAVVQQLGLPIRFIGAGEGIEDLRPFSSYEFVEALLSS
ncbi:MAG: signal recognition particle-docking protein FtsY [Synechococcales cyanobacterium M58_A2018_015]|nr:signal recognition particle-docking protein FtsY [Synechococcales cyanobacterium M58_A2018_015]